MLSLSMTPKATRLTPHEGLEVRLTLRNDGPEVLILPYLLDQTDAVAFRLAREDGGGERLMDGYTGQEMMSAARIDGRPSLLPLAPGETWDADIDLCKLHHLIPAGRFTLEARYAYAPVGAAARSEPCAVEVTPAPLTMGFLVEERSLIQSLVLLLTAEVDGERRTFVRQHGLQRPLASWYATEVAAARGADQVAVSTARHGTAPVADAAVERFVVWRRGAELCAQLHRMGRPTGSLLAATLPPDLELTPWSDHDLEGRLHLYATRPGELLAFRFEPDGLRPLFALAVPPAADIVVRGMDDTVDVIAAPEPGAPVRFTRLNVDGTERAGRELFARPAGRLLQLAYEPRLGRVRALFAQDGDEGLQGVVADVEGEVAPRTFAWRGLKGRPAPREGAFGMDKRGGAHLLGSDGRSLAYHPPAGGRQLIGQGGREAVGDASFLPYVVGSRFDAYLGSAHRATGYRFWEFQPHNQALRRYDTL